MLRLRVIASCPLPMQQLSKDHDMTFNDIQLIVDEQEEECDWLVICDDITPNIAWSYNNWVAACDDLRRPLFALGQRAWKHFRCPRENTVFFGYEPSFLRPHSDRFLRQFGHVVSCHEPYMIKHESVYFSAPYHVWFYEPALSYEQIAEACVPDKKKTISTICSMKSLPCSLQRQRLLFTRALQARLPELEVFGAAGNRRISSKRVGIDSYKYHLVIEDSLCPHYWTEKICDAFLGWSLPFYVGAENICHYFPERSLIRLDICDLEGSMRIMRQAMANDEYERRLSAIAEARRRVLQEYSFFRYVANTVSAIAHSQPVLGMNGRNIRACALANRLAIHGNPYHGVRYFIKKVVNFLLRCLEYNAKIRLFSRNQKCRK